ncbi:unnamed protein product [Blepharisma stoltei]|uniref:Uncharacterized protein n=1 Tax=Blepharisma stoltei TaxID=1481888 RepID=A0AAU9IVD5_9CILI|nr:unnamed protein product [Blepharisma stoltei]
METLQFKILNVHAENSNEITCTIIDNEVNEKVIWPYNKDSMVSISAKEAQETKIDILFGDDFVAEFEMITIKDGWIVTEKNIHGIKLELGYKIFSQNKFMQEVERLRNDLRISETSRVMLLEKLNLITEDMAKQSDETNAKFLEYFGANGKYERLMQKYKESIEKFKEREHYFIGKIKEVSMQKHEIETCLELLKSEKSVLESKLNSLSTEIETNHFIINDVEKVKELEFALDNAKSLLKSQMKVNEENLEQLRIFQSRNSLMSSQLKEFEIKAICPTEDESNYRFTFGADAQSGMMEDILESVIKETLHEKKMDLNVIQVSSGVFYIGKVRAEIKLDHGEVKAYHKKEYIPLDDFLDLQIQVDPKLRRSFSSGVNEAKSKTDFINESQTYELNPFDSLESQSSIETPEKKPSVKFRNKPDIMSYKASLSLKLAKAKGYCPVLKKKR